MSSLQGPADKHVGLNLPQPTASEPAFSGGIQASFLCTHPPERAAHAHTSSHQPTQSLETPGRCVDSEAASASVHSVPPPAPLPPAGIILWRLARSWGCWRNELRLLATRFQTELATCSAWPCSTLLILRNDLFLAYRVLLPFL